LGHLAYYLTTSAQVWQSGAAADAESRAAQRHRYQQCLEYVLGIVEDVLRTYDQAGALANTLVIITADHGEHLGEHGLSGHQASLHEELVNCPCALLAPNVEPGAQLAGLFQHTDLLQTVCGYLQVPMDAYLPGRAPRDILGASTAPGGHEHAFMEWNCWDDQELRRMQRRNPSADLASLSCDLVALRTDRWKYIRGSDRYEALYDLRTDPAEEHDLSGEEPEIVGELSSHIDAWLAVIRHEQQPSLHGADGIAPEQRRATQQKLRSLGYL
jgi:arylsulfatase A-like enzyme